jgi:NAD(P)-dependent dehydrogenase (short-subunit alcohol dehydrogenase family)
VDNTSLIELAAAIRMTCSNPAVVGAGKKPVVVTFDNSEQALDYSRGKGCLQEIAERLNFRSILEFSAAVSVKEIAETIAAAARSTLAIPNIIAVQNAGLFTIGRTKREALRYNEFLYAGKRFRMGSELEETMYHRLAGIVAVVTGSAQGFGKGIAEELAANGAHVVIADLNEELGARTALDIDEQFGEGRALFWPADVTSGESVNEMCAQAMRAFGGIDLFIANAGVLRAGSIAEMDERSFDLVTAVNYKAFFVCVKAVARIMRLQHRINPHHFMDIIQINSKSGLEGSNKNFAYAGSKFGAIGLTQSFAMELIDHHIKVNAICPGNYFEGPLWSDPENGLFAQYLRTGKAPGAKTIEDVKRFYMNKIPMKRGCTPADVAKAIFYIHEQEYETGQALPVTGGQVMLH